MAKNYSLPAVQVVYGNISMGGAYGESGGVSFEFDEDAYSKKVGASGEVTFVEMANESGIVTVTLMGSSAVNDLLTDEFNAQRRGGPAKALLVKDTRGNTLISTGAARIKRLPNVAYVKDGPGEREWVFLTDTVQVYVGGNVTA